MIDILTVYSWKEYNICITLLHDVGKKGSYILSTLDGRVFLFMWQRNCSTQQGSNKHLHIPSLSHLLSFISTHLYNQPAITFLELLFPLSVHSHSSVWRLPDTTFTSTPMKHWGSVLIYSVSLLSTYQHLMICGPLWFQPNQSFLL